MTGLIILFSLIGVECLAYAALTLAMRRVDKQLSDNDAAINAVLVVLQPRDQLYDQQEWDALDELQYRRAAEEQR